MRAPARGAGDVSGEGPYSWPMSLMAWSRTLGASIMPYAIMSMTSTGVPPATARILSSRKRTCGPSRMTSAFSAFASASASGTAQMVASMPRSSALLYILETMRLVDMPAEQHSKMLTMNSPPSLLPGFRERSVASWVDARYPHHPAYDDTPLGENTRSGFERWGRAIGGCGRTAPALERGPARLRRTGADTPCGPPEARRPRRWRARLRGTAGSSQAPRLPSRDRR